MASLPMIRSFLRMALVIFVLCLAMLLYTDRGTEGHRLMVYSVIITGVFIAMLAFMLKSSSRSKEGSDKER